MSDPDRSKAEGQRYIGCAVATIAEGESGDESGQMNSPATPRPRRKTWRAVHARGLKRSSTFRNYIQSEPRFHALLTEGASEVKLALV
jgi:hypothetical protein